MTEFRQIPDGVYKEAGEILRAVAGTGPKPEVEPIVRFENMVAGAALALEDGAPHALSDTQRTSADDWVKEGSSAWRMMHSATARVIDMHRTREQIFHTPHDVMTHIVADVVNQAGAHRMTMAIRDSHPAFRTGLSETQLSAVDYARDVPAAAADIRHQSYGAYDRLPHHAQDGLAETIAMGLNLKPALSDAVDRSYAALSRDVSELGYRNREVDERLADFAERDGGAPGRPLFAAATSESLRRVDELRAGDPPHGPLEAGIVAHMLVNGESRGGMDLRDGVADAAYARALVEQEGRSVTAPQIAVRLEAERVAVENARTRVYDDLDTERAIPDHVDQIAFERRFEIMAPESQVGLFQELEYGENVPGLKAMRLSVAAVAVEEAELGIGFVRGLSHENMTAEQIAAIEPDRFDGLYLPGDRVRIDEASNVRGVDKDALRETLGSEPLEVSRTVLVGTTIEDGMGGSTAAVRPEYEFRGREGRFPTGQFQHERGDEHVYGVVATMGERMYLVPLDDKADMDRAVAVGAAREIAATLRTRDAARNAETMSHLRDETREAPVAGEFVFRPEAFGRKDGPVELVAVPWMSGASDSEVTVARAAIEEERRAKAPSALVQAAMHAQAQGAGRSMSR